jgi:xylitol oxidase
MPDVSHNWAGNIAYAARTLHEPASVPELQAIVRAAGTLRPVGTRHAFNRLADSPDEQVSLRRLDRVLAIDAAARTVTVEGGITYGQLCPVLDAAGLALANLASLPHISVAGAVSTATHGSGSRNRSLAAAVAGLTLITAAGDPVTLRRGDAGFEGAVVALGALGPVSAMTLDLVPRFELRQNLYLGLPFAALVDNFEAIAAAAYSVSAFTRWRDDSVDFIWLKRLADAPAPPGDYFGARPAERPYHPIATLDPAPATEQMGVPGPWYERLPHFRLAFTPSAGAELQSEYFVARTAAPAALGALRQIAEIIAPPLLVSEIRTVAADGLWLSPAYGEDCVAVHFTWQPDWPAVEPVLTAIEAALAPFAVRPHWGKLFTMSRAAIQARYPRLAEFHALARQFDPDGKFRNGFLDAFVF